MKNTIIKKALVWIYEQIYDRWKRWERTIKYHLCIMTSSKTIRYIQQYGCSIARYGDGEFKLMLNAEDLAFQVRNDALAQGLCDTMRCQDSRLLLCVPGCLNTLKDMNEHARNHWFEWGRRNDNHRKTVMLIRQYAGKHYRFGDAQITRPYMDWKNKKRAEMLFPLLKSLWEQRDILIVEGEQTRLGVGNDLFEKAASIKRILAPAVNAFASYDHILQAVCECYNGELVLLALGPTATVLAKDLALRDIQALDIGHIDVEYEWYLQGVSEKIPISGKFVNEVEAGRMVSDCCDEDYLASIIARIG